MHKIVNHLQQDAMSGFDTLAITVTILMILKSSQSTLLETDRFKFNEDHSTLLNDLVFLGALAAK